MFARLKAYLQSQLQQFDREALWSPEIVKEAVMVVACWAIPAFSLVWLVDHFRESMPSVYLEKAISEGIGPHLWNVIGTLGLVLAGLAVLRPSSRLLAKSAYEVLVNTYAIGGLSFGLLFGQITTKLASASANIAAWKMWLTGAGVAFIAVQILVLNFVIWYLGHLMASRADRDGFLHRMEEVDLRLRFFAFMVLAVLPTALLFMEK